MVSLELWCPSNYPVKDYSASREIIEAVNKAMLSETKLAVTYHHPQRDAYTAVVHPYALFVNKQRMYLCANSEKHGEVRTFAVQRIKNAEPTVEPFQRPETFDLREFYSSAFGVITGEPQTVKLRFSPDVAYYVAETVWHPSQKIKMHEDGSITLSMKVAVTSELEAWVRSWGDGVAIV
jgi:predicted DNA-binding transcriptional regulator YafY